MKAIFKWIKWTLIALVLAVIFHNWTLKTVFSIGLRLGLGAPVDIEAAHLDFFNQRVTFEGILIKNPSGFQRGILAEIPKIMVDFDGAELQQGRLHLKNVDLQIEDFRLLRIAGGKMNVLGLKVFQSSGPKKPAAPVGAEPVRFQIDKVAVSLDHVSYKDTSGPEPVEQSFRVGIRNAVLERPDLESLTEAIVQESIRAAGLEKALEEGIRAFGLRNWMPDTNALKSLMERMVK